MLDANEAAFLQSIARQRDDNAAHLVFADWLEERGESPCAEFIRVQCELASSILPKKRQHTLRARERQLLDAHRHEWCQAFGLPIEEVHFERGLIARMRLSHWDQGNVLDPACAPRLATLTELDLSGLQLGDDGVFAFAKALQLPALRKLVLSDNGITDAGAHALASAAGLPCLDTIYLFQNPITAASRAALEQSSCFRLGNLDVGERAEGYCLSPGETEMGRRHYLRTQLLPVVSNYFTKYERLQSVMLCVAQYWADEANDAVHGQLIVSELFEPTMKGVRGWSEDESKVDPNLPNTRIISKYNKKGLRSAIGLWETDARWDENSGAIPLWAAFAAEEGSQEDEDVSESYSPAVMFYRHGGYEILPMSRPQLDGIRPEWGVDD
jgi:uncharacterized protein (TIGR02996 family)